MYLGCDDEESINDNKFKIESKKRFIDLIDSNKKI